MANAAQQYAQTGLVFAMCIGMLIIYERLELQQTSRLDGLQAYIISANASINQAMHDVLHHKATEMDCATPQRAAERLQEWGGMSALREGKGEAGGSAPAGAQATTNNSTQRPLLIYRVGLHGERIGKYVLEEAAKYVDEIIVVESEMTYSGQPSKVFLQDIPLSNATRLKVTHMLITQKDLNHTFVDWPQDAHAPWKREALIMDWYIPYVRKKYCNTGRPFLMYYADIDEVPDFSMFDSPEKLGALHALISHKKVPAVFDMQLYFYDFRWVFLGLPWKRAFVLNEHLMCEHEHQNTSSPEWRRVADTASDEDLIFRAGHHCSYCMSASEIADKIRSYSHQEFNTPNFTNLAYILKSIESGTNFLKHYADPVLHPNYPSNIPLFLAPLQLELLAARQAERVALPANETAHMAVTGKG